MSNVKEIYCDENFDVQVEEREGMLFLHCEVENFSKSVLKQMKAVMEEIKLACFYNGWNQIFSYTPNPKFGRLMGGKKIDEFTVSGKHYEVMVWELEQQLQR